MAAHAARGLIAPGVWSRIRGAGRGPPLFPEGCAQANYFLIQGETEATARVHLLIVHPLSEAAGHTQKAAERF